MLNSINIAGRITADCEFKYSHSGNAVGKFTLAVDRPKYKDKPKEVDFLDCVTFGKQAEGLSQYLTKGKPVVITGRIQTRIWEKDGVKRKAYDVIVEKLGFLPDGKGVAAREPGEEDPFNDEDCPF